MNDLYYAIGTIALKIKCSSNNNKYSILINPVAKHYVEIEKIEYILFYPDVTNVNMGKIAFFVKKDHVFHVKPWVAEQLPSVATNLVKVKVKIKIIANGWPKIIDIEFPVK